MGNFIKVLVIITAFIYLVYVGLTMINVEAKPVTREKLKGYLQPYSHMIKYAYDYKKEYGTYPVKIPSTMKKSGHFSGLEYKSYYDGSQFSLFVSESPFGKYGFRYCTSTLLPYCDPSETYKDGKAIKQGSWVEFRKTKSVITDDY